MLPSVHAFWQYHSRCASYFLHQGFSGMITTLETDCKAVRQLLEGTPHSTLPNVHSLPPLLSHFPTILPIGHNRRTVSLCNRSYSVPLSSRAVTNRRSFVGGSTELPITVTILGCRKRNATTVCCMTCTQHVSCLQPATDVATAKSKPPLIVAKAKAKSAGLSPRMCQTALGLLAL